MAIVKTNIGYKELPDLVYSSYQTDIFKRIEHDRENLLIEAVAGSGKTSTIVHACTLLEPRDDHIFLAFNKAIADELSAKVPPHVAARTMHSLCLNILRNNYKKVKVSARRVPNILYKELNVKNNKRTRDWYYEHQRDVCSVIGRIKALGLLTPTKEDIESLIYSMDLDIPNDDTTREIIFDLFWKSTAFDGDENNEIDFDDMIYHVVSRASCLDFPQYDTVVVDEAQDLNANQRMLLHHIIKEDGRLIAVGDTKQAIYGFRGADHMSMKHIKEEFKCKELPLSISYRCSQAVVAQAKEFVPQIEPRDNAPVGSVQSVLLDDYRYMVQSGDYILCRTWAPLMREAMSLGRNGHNVCMLGKDIAPSLIKWSKKIGEMYDSINKSTINDHLHLEIAGIPAGQEWKEYNMRDKAQTIAYVCGNDHMEHKDVSDIIKEIFTDKPPVEPHIMLSTIHRVKGGEADRVFILRPDLLPHPLAKGHNEMIQEDNLHYVAITRAKDSLWYIMEEE